MSTAILGNPNLFKSDQVLPLAATGTTIITKGDWVQFSGGFVVGLNTNATPAYRLSGIGVALENNPLYDELGVARANSALAVLTHGVIRVSGDTAASLTGAPGLGAAVYPATTASGIVGTTGATGVASIWRNTPRISVTATGTVGASGVGKLVNIVKAGDITASQWDVLFDARILGVDFA